MKEGRREFIKKTGIVAAAATLAPRIVHAKKQGIADNEIVMPAAPVPTTEQRNWMDLGFGMFIHFGINTYYDMEWSDGTLDPSKFNPVQLDTDQWCRVAKEAGMKYVVINCKHHDGFCNWPTKLTNYSVAATPFNGDVIGELVNSANKYGLKVGMYYSLWDRHEKSHDTDEPKYIDFMKGQLYELLTNYGPVIEMWFDGFWKKQQSGWLKKIDDITGEKVQHEKQSRERDEKFICAWRMEGAYRWQMDHVYQFIKSLQPSCLVMNNSTTAYPGVPLHPVDIRSGEKYTTPKNDQKVWNWLGKDIYLPMQIETTMSQKGNKQFPTGSWFWHPWDHSVASKEQIMNYLSVAKKMEANLLLNCGPMDTGRLRPEDEETLLNLLK